MKKINKLISIILSIVMLTSITAGLDLTAYADDTEYKDGIWTYTVSNGEATIIGNDSISGDQIIPSIVGGKYPVTAISGWFGNTMYNSFLTSITIPDSVKSIHSAAFNYCTKLKSVIIGNGLTIISDSTFSCCFNLENITIGNNVTSIGNNAFGYCTELKSITIPNSVTSIGDYAFNGCSGLTSITIPDSVTSIGYEAFYNCTGLKSVTVGTGITSIKAGTFGACTSLTDVYYPLGKDEFSKISIDSSNVNNAYFINANNDYFINATIHYYYNCTHVNTKIENVAATCTTAGIANRLVCATCGTVINEGTQTPALGHDFGTNNATCSRCNTANPNYVAPNSNSNSNNDYDYDDDDYDYDDDDYDYYEPTKVKLSDKKITLGIYDSYILDYSFSPSDSYSDVSWSSSNKKVATVNSWGEISPKGLGTANIKIKTDNGKTAKCKVVVNWSYLSCFSGSSRTLPKINGKSGGNWTSSNKKIAKIKKGKVYALKAGNVTLKCKKGKITYTVRFHVVSYNTLLKKTKASLKDRLKDPSSLKIYHIWRGYDSDGDPTIILDSGGKNSYGAMVRNDYYVGYSYYNAKKKKTVYGKYFSDNMPKLKSKKKIF